MIHIALYQPEIPPNTGNIIRLCANTKAQLHLIHPLSFELSNKHMRRAGLDYHEWAHITHYKNEDEFLAQNKNRRIFACSTKGKLKYSEVTYQDEDMFLFGSETRGLPDNLRNQFTLIRIPMSAESRSMNLSNSVAVILYEALKQLDFPECV